MEGNCQERFLELGRGGIWWIPAEQAVLAGQGRTACRDGGPRGHGAGVGLAPVSLHGGARGIAEGAEETAMLVIKHSGGTEEIETTG